MIRGFSADQVRAAEAPLLDVGEPLMLRAAHSLAGHVREQLCGGAIGNAPPTQRVLVLAGSGANGGDGLHAAAILRRDGITADALLTAETCHAEGADALREAGGTLHCLAELTARPGHALEGLLGSSDLVLDAILGIGGRPEVPGHLRRLLDHLRRAGTPVIAVDLPSFLDASTGEAAQLALPARTTVTFGAVKAGLLLPGGSDLAGDLHLVDLGLGPHLPSRALVERLEDEDVRRLWPRAGRDDSKYTRGVVAIAAGSTRYPGAAVLACSGAARAGAGMVRCLAPAPVLDLVLRARPEVLGHPVEDGGVDLADIGRTQALVVGPGLPGDDARARSCIEALREDGQGPHRGVIDAGGLDALDASDAFGADVVLTPHRGEAQRLARRLDIDPELAAAPLARALAEATGATVLMKGAVTVIAPPDPEAPLLAQDDATGYLATAGTGDVLAGILGTLLAAGLPGSRAAALAAVLHGRAGRAASHDGLVPLVALDVAERVPEVLATILTGTEHHSEASEGAR
ncbi:hydroxyethylthiazole kinase-like uncharacterized protein yjeF [Brachybacterium muris]|uniref:NAD(P)H-hydrate dehydratase n=1 Tax=Brachybacterium muris TaxID=219301 RepID=UPI00195E1DF0|nr:NAD(P)H-hydrate dehydratase [Brachybacterium muris]MBM7501569.1 hydroxyethylthiazole kinase-like uncharacterized protein yjeF [Brachybacterium muris]MCT1430979.1 NAD(P)H-hydrate dehydratase [Brachybacterium muris]MCT2296156.1 NAD(P)H-hydrate dehydratase [Brachybacterium muris]